MSRICLMISLKKVTAILSVLGLIYFMVGCGGGGGGGDDDNGGGGGDREEVTISGTADDGTSNSPIRRAECTFVDLIGNRPAKTTANNDGQFSIKVPINEEGHIRCSPENIPKLILSTFLSTEGRKDGDKISGEGVTPATTVVADIIDSENPAVPTARKLELLNAIVDDTDPEHDELSLLVQASQILFKEMMNNGIDVIFGGGGEGGGYNGSDDGGGVGGDAGDGADFSPIPNARCDFALELEGNALFHAALEDLRDGKLDRPDLADIKDEVEEAIKDIVTQLENAFIKKFPDGVGKPYSDETEDNGRYFLPIPPEVQGFVRCTPPNLSKLKLATFVSTEGLADGDKILGQDVTPATTFFSHSVATELSDDLITVKENYLDDIAGLGDIHIVKDGETITEFTTVTRQRPHG